MVKKRSARHVFTGRRPLADLQRFLNAKCGGGYGHRRVRLLLEELSVPLYPRQSGTWKFFYAAALRDQSRDLSEQFEAWWHAECAAAPVAAA